jgi:hypothetical protein
MSHSGSPRGRNSPRFLGIGVLGFLCFIATTAPAAAPTETTVEIRSAQAALDDDVYELDARLDLQLPQAAREVIEGGLPMRLTYQIEVSRVRRYMPDAGVVAVEQTYEIGYHALSQRYLVRNLNTGEQQDFGSLEAAIDRLSDVRGLPILDAALLNKGAKYEGRIRAVLDMNTASDAFGWLLFWTDDWSATSGWHTWTLRP